MNRWLALGVVAVLLALVIYGGASGAAKEQKVTIVLSEFKFTPATVTLQAGVPAEMTLVNRGAVIHEFSVYTKPPAGQKITEWDEWVIPNTYFQGIGEVNSEIVGYGTTNGTILFEFEVPKGRSVTIKFVPTRKGTFEMGCHQAGHYEAGMVGTVVVK
jgi:uncharacterized cupredoxin-like copper-binding protein